MGIPARIHASSAVAHGEQHEGTLAIKLLPRVAEALPRPDATGRLQVSLRASKDPGYASLQGRISGELPMQCRRCDRTFGWKLDLDVNLRLVRSEAEEKQALARAGEAGEPYLVENDELPLREIVEDEVLLALPMLPRCQSCENEVNAAPAEKPEAALKEPRRENPFAALKKQLK